ncbi:class I SAM-dependent methyltransferase [Autumnicola psychrophila]|uniref:Class I SAM-dependent methyltransferase n=1 Tax=Autumnicola psychrophila TaxID=3075592 RepID=A0ABU3DRY0_9FLAO|nr:class I SAM-dependent methyltransferase [Zunongwangia sp. F225]MDT0686480.1 class I SAM-dependent methyltransferase [Zunongwangia sp. F225]
MKEFWNERYKEDDYVYGKDPNKYLKVKLNKIKPGRILFPAEGEGRNAVFAAKLGWDVSSFDISIEGKKKALRLAEEEGVIINYQTTDSPDLAFAEEKFDVIALVYAHFPPEIRRDYFNLFKHILKKGGKVIFEGFGSKHPEYQTLNPSVGGPKEEKILFSEKEIREAFQEFNFEEFYEGEIVLNEGKFHKGKGYVIRFVAEKKS